MSPTTCDVVIIGAGIIGTSIAHHLAKKGLTDVIVVEREIAAGMGSTAKAAGGIRAQFGSAINIQLSKLSLEAFERFPQETGADVAFNQVGYLWLATQPPELEVFKKNVTLQRAMGLDVRLVMPDEIARIAPYVRTDDLLGGTFHARDGYAPPADYVQGYFSCSKSKGVRYLFSAEVKEILMQQRKVVGLRTNQGDIQARRVVCAAGAYSGLFGPMIGIDIPVKPVRRQCFVTQPITRGLPHPIPMIVDYTTGIYIHSESGGVLMGMADKGEPTSFNQNIDHAFLEKVAELAMHRMPLLEHAEMKTGWAGLYEVTPDNHPILGGHPDLSGFYVACGFSGHGVMHAPATGQLMAEWLMDGKPSMDLTSLRWSRFQEGELIQESHVI